MSALRRIHAAACAAALCAGCCGPDAGGEEVMFDFATRQRLPRTSDRTVTISRVDGADPKALRMASERGPRPGVSWPEISLVVPERFRDLSKYAWVALDVRNVGRYPVGVYLRVRNPGGTYKYNGNAAMRTVSPGRRCTVRLDLRKRMGRHAKIEMGRLSLAYPLWSNQTAWTIDPARVTRCDILVARRYRDYPFAIELERVRVGGREWLPPVAYEPPKPPFPFVDEFGQYMHESWKGKIAGVADLKARRKAEAAQLARYPQPPTWNRWGGLKNGPQLEATGHFRVAKYKGKWWLVDPAGRLFYSVGVNGINTWACTTQLEGRRHWFDKPPGPVRRMRLPKTPFRPKAIFGEAVNVGTANLARKYGDGWLETFADLTAARLRSWGLNTMGQGCQGVFYRKRKLAYTVNIGSGGARIEASRGPWAKFPDPFDPRFEASIRRRLTTGRLAETTDDPWCLGYYSDNELAWGGPVTLALWSLRCPAEQASKKALVADLKERYANIAALNEAWGTDLASWRALLDGRDTALPATQAGRNDLARFSLAVADRYFATWARVLRELAPHKLYLGCRFAGQARAALVEACARHCDVVTCNLYVTSVEHLRYPARTDRPVMVTEFNFSARSPRYFYSQGFTKAGLGILSEDDRAGAFLDYVTGAARHRRIVGCHWHRYQDDPPSGNFIGENNQWGFVDICDTPYDELIGAARKFQETVLTVRLGR